ncbi:MAG: ankyrin repeat domain-containing protein [Chitinophagaceae bacterium]|nr:ankyrin repeat domain-containing protein [Anaerolineae bacterium]
MDNELIRAFVIAAHGNLSNVQEMLAENPDLLRVEYEWQPGDLEDGIGAAAHVGNREIAEFFLEQGVSLNICVAAMLGRQEDVKSFLEKDPALANAKGAHGISLMFHAAMSGSVEIAKLLKEHGCNEGYNHALHGAINHKQSAMVRWLLENGVTDVNTLDYQGKTPLKNAQESGQIEVAAMLEERKALLEV